MDNRQTENMPWNCFISVSEGHLIVKCPKQPKENKKRRNQVRFNENDNCACKNGENNSNQKMCLSIARMSVNDKCLSGNFGDS